MRIGIIGCGNISDIYFQNCRMFDVLEVLTCADIAIDRAQAKAQKYGIARFVTPDELLRDPDIGLVINLTRPQDHAEVIQRLLQAGKHVYSEKPLAVTRAEGRRLLDSAASLGLRLGCAPDSFMGAGLQACRKVVDDGLIGQPLAAVAFMMNRGPEAWHPEPDFFFKPGGGPLFDMGPHYLTAMINLLGPVRRVSASAASYFPERIIGRGPRAGQKITVETPTHVSGTLEFANGALGTLVFSFDVWSAQVPYIEVYGSDGSLSMPDPNFFGGPVRVHRPEERGWREIPLSHSYERNSRGVGAADMVYALRSGRPHRASAEMAFHVLDIMESLHESARTGKHVDVSSTCERPAPLPPDLAEGQLDA